MTFPRSESKDSKMRPMIPTRASLRKVLFRVLPLESYMRRLCVDYFPELVSQISTSGSLDNQITQLMELAKPDTIVAALEQMEDRADALARCIHLLVAEQSPPASASSLSAAPETLTPSAPTSGSRRRRVQPPKSAYDPTWYVSRKEEEEQALAALEYPGAAVVLQAPELFGKTWLLEHLLAQIAGRGRIVNLHLRAFGPDEILSSLSGFLRELARQLAEATLALSPDETAQLIDQIWRRANNPIDNLRWLMVRHILPTCGDDQWLILAIDGVDALGEQPYLEDFFTMLRAWMDSAAQRPWSALRLLLTLSTSPHLLIRNVDGSPFNIAETLILSDFEQEQRTQLAQLHGAEASDYTSLTQLVGGHPYLLRLGFYEAQRTGASLAEVSSEHSSLFIPYLEHCARRLQKQPVLYAQLRKVLSGQPVTLDHDQINRLRLAGFLVRAHSGALVPRYAIFARLLSLYS